MINQRNNPAPTVAKEIHPSLASKLKKPSPLIELAMQSMNHIKALAP